MYNTTTTYDRIVTINGCTLRASAVVAIEKESRVVPNDADATWVAVVHLNTGKSIDLNMTDKDTPRTIANLLFGTSERSRIKP